MALGDGDRILSQQTADAGNKAIFTVAGTPTDGGSYIEVPVVVESATGSGAAWQDITIAFLYAGGDGGTGGGAVDSVNGETGVVVLDATDIDDVGPGRLWMTQAERDQISTSAGLVAEDVPITDAGGYYGSTDVEGALQAVAATVEFKVSSLDLDAIDVVTAAEFAGLTPDPATLYLLVG